VTMGNEVSSVSQSQHQQQSCKHHIPTFCLTGLQIGKHVVSFIPHSYQYNLVVFIFMLSWWFVTDPTHYSLSLSQSKLCAVKVCQQVHTVIIIYMQILLLLDNALHFIINFVIKKNWRDNNFITKIIIIIR